MTKQEFNDLYDSLYYGHEAELELHNKHYFLEWNKNGIDIYSLNANQGIKITSILNRNNDKGEVISELFSYKFDGSATLNDSFSEINVVDIE